MSVSKEKYTEPLFVKHDNLMNMTGVPVKSGEKQYPEKYEAKEKMDCEGC